MTVKFKRFFETFKPVEELCEEAARFATSLLPDRLINISEGANGVIVWYWDNENENE